VAHVKLNNNINQLYKLAENLYFRFSKIKICNPNSIKPCVFKQNIFS